MSSKKSFKSKPLFIAAEYNGRKATVLRTPKYKDTINAVKRAFKPLRSAAADDIEIYAWFEEHADLIRITEDLWSDLLPEISKVKILLDTSEGGLVIRNTASTRPATELGNVTPRLQAQKKRKEITKDELILQPVRTSKRKINVTAVESSGRELRFNISPDTRIEILHEQIAKTHGVCPGSFRLLFNGDRVSDLDTPNTVGMVDGDVIDIMVELAAGKPVIYLFPPAPIPNICLNLSLVPSWRFSALYPPTPMTTPALGALAQAASWVVDAKPDGTLFDQGTQREVSYLFWEAHTNPAPPLSPIASRPSSPSAEYAPADTVFDPARPEVTSANSILLPFDRVTAYIDDALLSLGLHTEARTSFITYWLPDLQRHDFVALRFLPQTEYEAAAPMKVEPAPDVTTRVFMLFQGVEESQLDMWVEAQARATESPSMWTSVVDINSGMVKDEKLFRVLEWGGMEIK